MTDFFSVVTKTANDGKSTVVIFIYKTKASVPAARFKLSMAVKSYVIKSNLLAWYSFYLISRFRLANVNITLFNTRPISSEIIQGGILGPLLFLLYINIIMHVIPLLLADKIKVAYNTPTRHQL